MATLDLTIRLENRGGATYYTSQLTSEQGNAAGETSSATIDAIVGEPVADLLEKFSDGSGLLDVQYERLARAIGTILLPPAIMKAVKDLVASDERVNLRVTPDGDLPTFPWELASYDGLGHLVLNGISISRAVTFGPRPEELGDMRVLIAGASPQNLPRFAGLSALAGKLTDRFDGTTISGRRATVVQRELSRNALDEEGPQADVALLFCHGDITDGKPVIHLVDDDGRADTVPVDDVAQALASCRLVFLFACHGGSAAPPVGPGDVPDGAILSHHNPASFCSRLADAGTSGVSGFQGRVKWSALTKMSAAMVEGLLETGSVSHAVASAREAVREEDFRAWARLQLYQRGDADFPVTDIENPSREDQVPPRTRERVEWRGADLLARSAVAAEVESWWVNETSRTLVVRGGPGEGKSSFLVHLLDQRRSGDHPLSDTVVFAHFCEVTGDVEQRPDRFIQRWSESFANQLPAFRAQLKDQGESRRREQGDQHETLEQYCARRVLTPLLNSGVERDVLLVVDALDERREIAQLLASVLGDAPSNLRALLTSRPEVPLPTPLQDHPIDIATVGAGDVRRWSEQRLRAGLERPPKRGSIESLAAEVAQKANENFLVAATIVADLLEDPELNPAAWPESLDEAWERESQRIERLAASDNWKLADHSPWEILGIAGGALANLPTTVLEGALGSVGDVRHLNAAIASLRHYMAPDAEPDTWQIFHGSFRQFLSDNPTTGGPEPHVRIAKLIDDPKHTWDECEPYLVRSIAHHLAQAVQREANPRTRARLVDRFAALCADFDWLAHRLAYVGAGPLLDDLALAAQAGVDELPEPTP